MFSHGYVGYSGGCAGTHVDIYTATHMCIQICTNAGMYVQTYMIVCVAMHTYVGQCIFIFACFAERAWGGY